MEPERNIEKLLRAFAKKRRNEAGDAFRLHPATRRLLQGEVARRAPKSPDAEAAPTAWTLFRQRLAFVASAVFILAISAALLLPSLSASKRKAQSIEAINNLKQIGLATKMSAEANDGLLPVTLDALTNELGGEKALFDPQSGQRFIYLGDGKNLNNLQSNVVLAYSAEDKKGRAVLLADGSVSYVKPEQFGELMNRSAPELARADGIARRQLPESAAAVAAPAPLLAAKAEPSADNLVAVNKSLDQSASRKPEIANEQEKTFGAPAGGAIAGNNFEAVATNAFSIASAARDRGGLDVPVKSRAGETDSTKLAFGMSQHFIQNGAVNAQNLFKNIATPIQKIPVLANFQVQQNGNAISVVDADGSVYKGSFDSELALEQNQPATLTTTLAPGTPPQMQGKDSGVAQNIQSAILNNSFHVSGLNQTLKQNVVFAGNLIEMTAIATAAPSNAQTVNGAGGFGGGGGAAGQSQLSSANQSQALLWSNTRITGTAVIDKTNQVEINAVPLAP